MTNIDKNNPYPALRLLSDEELSKRIADREASIQTRKGNLQEMVRPEDYRQIGDYDQDLYIQTLGLTSSQGVLDKMKAESELRKRLNLTIQGSCTTQYVTEKN